jgi:hypothetical protein
VKGDLTYVTHGIIWRITRPHANGAWYATITDAVPGMDKQPEVNRWSLTDLLDALDVWKG